MIANSYAQSRDVVTVIVERQETKKRTGWTLSDWLDTKYRIGLQNQWLAFHSGGSDGVLYDFYLGGGGGEFKMTGDNIPVDQQDVKEKEYNFFGAFYISLIGIEYRYEKSNVVYSQDEGNVDLRIFGTSTQTTNLVLQYGVRNLNEIQFGKFQQQFAGGYLGIYIFRFLGIEGRYRNYFWNTVQEGDMKMMSQRFDYGVFLEVQFLRIFANIFQEKFDYENPELVQERNGLNLGIRINF